VFSNNLLGLAGSNTLLNFKNLNHAQNGLLRINEFMGTEIVPLVSSSKWRFQYRYLNISRNVFLAVINSRSWVKRPNRKTLITSWRKKRLNFSQ
jgi:hypothetical protein